MMSGFEQLREISNLFTDALRRSSENFSVKTNRDFDEAVFKKMRDMKLFSSKLKLLQAKPFSFRPQIREQPLENALDDYGDTVMWKVLENLTVKSLTQTHAVKALITTPDTNLDLELAQRKKAILQTLSEYHRKEKLLRNLDEQLKQREVERSELTAQWDRIMGSLRDMQNQKNSNDDGNRGPLYVNLSKLVEKLEIMRWLICKLVCARVQHYDWLEDPHQRLSVLELSRVQNNVDMFTRDT